MRLMLALAMALLMTGAADAAIASGGPLISAPEAIVIDGWTGNVLYARHANTPRAPASTVKIMTALVVLRHHVALGRVVSVSPLAVQYGGTSAGLYAGERITVWNLLHGMLLPSGNDAAVALAQTVAPTPQQFVVLMNREAARLHLRRTRFLTPNGFDRPGQFTTARDLARLARVAMQQPAFLAVVRTRAWTAYAADGRGSHFWQNLNKLLWSSAAVDGVKTGTTPAAGACLVSSARSGGKWIIAVNMGSSVAARFADGAALLNYGLKVDQPVPSTG